MVLRATFASFTYGDRHVGCTQELDVQSGRRESNSHCQLGKRMDVGVSGGITRTEASLVTGD